MVTCNLSVKREAVLAVGSFDPAFSRRGRLRSRIAPEPQRVCVRYVPEAQTIHQHLPFTVPDLIRRAGVYGETQLPFLRKHPALLGDGATFFGMLDEAAADKWRALIAQRKQEIEDLAAMLTRIDSLDFAPFLTMKKGDGTVADEITRLFPPSRPRCLLVLLFFRAATRMGQGKGSSIHRGTTCGERERRSLHLTAAVRGQSSPAPTLIRFASLRIMHSDGLNFVRMNGHGEMSARRDGQRRALRRFHEIGDRGTGGASGNADARFSTFSSPLIKPQNERVAILRFLHSRKHNIFRFDRHQRLARRPLSSCACTCIACSL